MIQRNISDAALQALKDTPVVLINGARQTGKSTLVRWISEHGHPARYLTLDDSATLTAAHRDPTGFISNLEGPVILDEVQLAPDLFRAIKLEVDRQRSPGRFLLTGSANVLMLPRVSESLAGRIEIITLWPFSQGELRGIKEDFVGALFKERLPSNPPEPVHRTELLQAVLTGGYPEAVSRTSADRRNAWFKAYLATLVQRDIRDLADIEGRTQLPRLLEIIAAQAMSLVNAAELSRGTGIPQTTLKRYLSLLEATFLTNLLPSWSGSTRKRLLRTPKIFLNDTGLLSHLLNIGPDRLTENTPSVGPLIENMVAAELMKQLTWSKSQARLFYYRTASGQEVDFVLEGDGGRICGIEVKASATLDQRDWRGIEDLAEAVGKRFWRGIILYAGREVIPFGKNMHALPMTALWQL